MPYKPQGPRDGQSLTVQAEPATAANNLKDIKCNARHKHADTGGKASLDIK
jgi:hypothetical protein